jgi:uncharacterized damage-inducible protein DinB
VKDVFLTYAKYHKEADKAVLAILSKLSIGDLEKDRGSYYGSLFGLAKHILEGSLYLQGLLKAALSHNTAALKILASLEGISIPKDTLTEAQWKKVVAAFDVVDDAFISLVASLTDTDLKVPVKVPWYGGKPDAVPLSFLLQSFVVHGTHHRGHISQILDELKIDHDFSGLKADLLSC